MKQIYFIFFALSLALNAEAQLKDTLRNLAKESGLTINQYSTGGNWGFWTGHNYLGRQQFAEKYYINGTVNLQGVISHLTGKVTPGTQDSSAFNVWTVGNNNFPAVRVASKAVKNVVLDVSGNAYPVTFDSPVQVQDSFFVAFDLYDYSHHAHPDTLGILYGTNGSRPAEDKFGRNVIQVHSHGTPVWRDFYTQNFTPVCTYLAIYPIIEFTTTSVKSSYARSEDIKIFAPYPNPATTTTNIEFQLSEVTPVYFSLLGTDGREIFRKELGVKHQGVHQESISLEKLSTGSYIILIQTDYSAMATRITIQ